MKLYLKNLVRQPRNLNLAIGILKTINNLNPPFLTN